MYVCMYVCIYLSVYLSPMYEIPHRIDDEWQLLLLLAVEVFDPKMETTSVNQASTKCQ